jgi:hypothetical protein
MSERYSASTLTTTTLEFQFLRGGDAYDAYSVDSVSIYSSYADAQSESSPIQTITSSSITRVSTGLYQYEVAIISTAGTYFDKIFITPTDGGTQINFINTFYIVSESTSPTQCNIYGSIIDSEGEPYVGVRVYAVPTTIPALVETSTGIVAVTYEPRSTITDADGYFTLSLVRSLSFNVTIKEIGLKDTVTIPDSDSANLFSLLGETVQTTSGHSGTDWT